MIPQQQTEMTPEQFAALEPDQVLFTMRIIAGALIAGVLMFAGIASFVVFSGGIGENSFFIRSGVCRNMSWAGIELDEAANASIARGFESNISAVGSKTQIWVLPTNEEIVVAQQSVEAVKKK